MKNTKLCSKNAIAISFCLFISANLYSATYYVSPNGNDASNGSKNSPFKTLQKGSNTMKAGDTVFVRAGTYASLLYLSTTGTEANRAVFINYPGERPIIDGEYNKPSGNTSKTDPISGKTADSYPLIMVEGSYITFSGFEIIRSAGAGVSLANYQNNSLCHHNIVENLYVHDCRNKGIWCYNASNITIQNCEVTLTANFASYDRSGSPDWPSCLQAYGCTNVKILKNKVHENWGEGIGVWNDDNVLVDSNIVYDNSSGNIYLDNASNSVVSSNLIYNTRDPRFAANNTPSDAINLADEPTVASKGGNLNIWNNTIFGCQNGIRWRDFQGGSGMKNMVIAFNTIVNPTNGKPVEIQAGNHSNVAIRNNIFVQENNYGMISIANDNLQGFTLSNNLWSKEPTSIYKSPSDVVGDPKLAKTGLTTQGNLTNIYFKLLSTSPAINKGLTLAQINVDMYKQIRDNKPDLGAHEYISTITSIVAENDTRANVKIYPNPASATVHIINVEVGYIIQVYEATGKLIISQKATSENTELNLQALPQGLYMVKVGNRVQKLMVE